MNDLARQAIQRLGLNVDVTQPLGNYSIAIQQMVAIARSLEILSAKVLILDEPTSSLDIHETNRLFEVMRKLKSDGHWYCFHHPFPGSGVPDCRPDHGAPQW